jgi:hypothetical protein
MRCNLHIEKSAQTMFEYANGQTETTILRSFSLSWRDKQAIAQQKEERTPYVLLKIVVQFPFDVKYSSFLRRVQIECVAFRAPPFEEHRRYFTGILLLRYATNHSSLSKAHAQNVRGSPPPPTKGCMTCAARNISLPDLNLALLVFVLDSVSLFPETRKIPWGHSGEKCAQYGAP